MDRPVTWLLDCWRFAANSQTVVLGRPTRVTPERAVAHRDMGHGEPRAEELAFADPSADYRTWLITLDMESVVAGANPTSLMDLGGKQQLAIRMTANGGPIDVGDFASGLLGLGRSVWFLTHWDDQPGDAFRVAWVERGVGVIDRDGALRFPLLPDADASTMVPDHVEVEDLRRWSKEPDARVPSVGGG